MIEVSGLCKQYPSQQGTGNLEVLRDISFKVPDGEFLGIIGPSGCGKTTLLKILGGIVPFEGGQIHIDGELLKGPGADRRLVFQDFALLPWRTILGNVEFGLEVKGVAKDERKQRAMEAICRTGLAGFENYYPYQISGGMQQRAGLARALVMNPKTLLMDEPFGALDAQTRRSLQEDLLQLMESSGRTVVLVTHDMDEAVLLCDRVLVLESKPGRIGDVVAVAEHLPRPRAGRIEDVRAQAVYGELVRRIWNQLSAGSGVSSRA